MIARQAGEVLFGDEGKVIIPYLADPDVLESNYPHAALNIVRRLQVRAKGAVPEFLGNRGQRGRWPPHGIGDGVAEHVEEGGLEEGVELGESLAALGPHGVRRIQNPRNPLLLGERRQGDLRRLDFGIRHSRLVRPYRDIDHPLHKHASLDPVKQEP